MKKLFLFFISPVAVFYLLAVVIRNKFFDMGILRSKTFDLPVICIGNLSTGGTGKTPHTEYIARLLEEKDRPVAILSRGYKRKTSGFLIVESGHTHHEAGDEPCQYKKRLEGKNIMIAVDSDRVRGIRRLTEMNPKLKAIILDDAYQHRYVKAGLNILLTDYYTPFFNDNILPFGNLREPKSGMKRAHMIIITKSPPVVSPLVRKDIIVKSKISPQQQLFFTKIQYGPVTSFDNSTQLDPKTNFATIFLFTGVANPYPLEEHLKSRCLHIECLKFPDHHTYTLSDIQKILNNFDAHISSNKILVTTEKDMMRLQSPDFTELLTKYPLYYVPISIVPDKHDKENINKTIIDYVRENQRNL